MFQCMILAITAVMVGLDQLTKWLSVMYLRNGDAVTVIPGVLDFSYTENSGAAFSILSDERWFLVVITMIVMIALGAFVLFGQFRHYKLFNLSATLILAGGIGNLIDRLLLGYVVDFLKVTFMDFPIFNVADCFVVVGSVLLLIFFCFVYEDKKASTTEDANGTVSDDSSGG